MATEILMPALSPTMEEGTLAKWLVKEGDTITSGMIIAEIERTCRMMTSRVMAIMIGNNGSNALFALPDSSIAPANSMR